MYKLSDSMLSRSARVLTLLAFLFFLVSTIMNSTCFAGQAQGTAPKIELAQDYWYFGYMIPEAIVHHDFWIRNVGSDTLKILKVEPGCGCTTAPLSKTAIPPGDSAQLSVLFDTKNMIGKMIKDIAIKSNDPAKPDMLIKFMGVVNQEHPLVKAKPSAIRFMMSSSSSKMQKTMMITNGFNNDIELKVVDYPRSTLKISSLQTTVKAHGTFNFEVEQLAPVLNENEALSSITLEFSSTPPERITVPVVNYFKRKN